MAIAQTERMVVVGKRPVAPRTALSKTVIDAGQIRAHGYRSVNEVLSAVPGLSVSTSGGRHGQTSVFMRGAESDHVLVVIDGIRVSDPSSGNRVAFEALRPGDLRRVVVVRGPQSARYGARAIGGVIHIETRRGTARPEGRARVEAASDNEAAGYLGFSGTHGAWDYSVGMDHRRSDGDSVTPSRLRGDDGDEKDGWRSLNVNASLGWDLESLGRLIFTFGESDSRNEYDAPSAPFDAAGYHSDSDERRMGFSYESRHLEFLEFLGLTQIFARASRYHRLRHEASPSQAGKDRYRGQRVRYEVGGRFLLGEKADISLAYENELETASARSAFSNLYGTTRSESVYMTGEYDWSDDAVLSAAWRHDDVESYGGESSMQLGVLYRLPEWGVSARVNYATAFKAPNEDERRGFGGNADLKAEKARGWDIGVDKVLGSCGMGMTYFWLQTRDLIEYDFASMLLENVGRARSEGIESYLECSAGGLPGGAVTTRMDWTLMRAADDEHQRLLRRPIRQMGVSLDWDAPFDLRVALRAAYTGPREDIARDTFMRVRKGGYTLTHLNVRRQLSERLDAYLRVGNLFDKKHEAVDGYAGERFSLHLGLATEL